MKITILTKTNLSLRKLIYYILLLNPVLSLALDGTNIHFHYIQLPLLAIAILICLYKKPKHFLWALSVCVLTCYCAIFAFASGSSLGKINNHFACYIATILLLIFSVNDVEMYHFSRYIKNHISTLIAITVLINIVELFMIVTHQGFVYVYSWSGTFFQGTSGMPHTLSYLMLVAMIFDIIIVLETKKKYYAALSILPIYCIFISGARVTLLLGAILTCVLLSFVFTEKQKNLFVKFLKLSPLVVLVLAVFWDKILASDVINKIISRSESGNASAGRFYMIQNLWGHFLNDSNFLQYIFGQGDDKTYYYNSTNPLVNVSVWAHNDIMQILVGKGLVGIVMYITALFAYFKALYRRSGNIYSFAIIVLVVISAVLNGFYSYRDISLCIPFMMMMNNELSYRKTLK